MSRRIVRGCMVSIILATCVLLGRAESGTSQETAPREPPTGMRVFVTGHSFHVFVAPRLEPLTKAAGIKRHALVGTQMIGASRVISHWFDLPPAPADNKPSPPEQRDIFKMSKYDIAKPSLVGGNVDVFTMSPIMSYVPDDGIDRFVELGLKHNSKMRFLVQASWVGWDGTLPGEKITKAEERDTRSLEVVTAANKRFREALELQAGRLNTKVGHDVVFIAPVGDAVLKLRELIAAGKAPGVTKQSQLFMDLIGHGTEPVLSLTTYVNFACIYRVSPVGLKVAKNAALDQLSPKLDPLLRQIAWDTVTSYSFSGVKPAMAAGQPSK